MRLAKLLASFVLFLFVPAAVVYAQTSSGQISGQVVDPSGAAVVDATVTLKNQLTDDMRTVKTLASGEFVFVGVQPGEFAVLVQAPGFKRFEKPGGKHVSRGLNHALAHAGDKAADVDVTGVLDFSFAARVFQVEFARAFYKSWLALAFNDKLVVFRGGDVL